MKGFLEKSLHKLVFYVFAVLMMCTVLSTVAFAAVVASGTCGAEGNESNVAWSLEDGVLTISGSGATAEYSASPWKTSTTAYNVTAIVVGEGVTELGKQIFRSMTDVESISLPASIETIGVSVFTDMGSLTTITVAEKSQYFVIDASGVLYSKDFATVYKYPDGKTDTSYTVNASCTTIGSEAFFKTTLEELILPDNLEGISSWSIASAHSLESITIPNTVTHIDSCAFSGSSAITKLIFEENSTLETIASGAFYSTGITGDLVIPASVKTIGEESSTYGAFSSGHTLTSVSFEEGSQCTFIGNKTFWGNGGGDTLTSVTIPESVTYIGGSAFANLTGLKTVTIEGNADGLEIGTYAFDAYMNKSDFTDEATTEVTIGTKTATPISVGSYAFAYCDTVEINGCLTDAGGNAFSGCVVNGSLSDGGIEVQSNSILRAFIGATINTILITSDEQVVFATQALEGAYELTTVKIDAPSIQVAQSSFNNTNIIAMDMVSVEEITYADSTNIKFGGIGNNSVIYFDDTNVLDGTGAYSTSKTAIALTNGGTFADDTVFTAGTLATPTKEGSIFLGWYDNADLTDTAVTTATAGETYYAGWKTVNDIKITTDPTDTEYYEGQTLDTTGMVVSELYDDESIGDSITKYTVTYENGSAFSLEDTYATITATIDDVEYTATVDVTVIEMEEDTFKTLVQGSDADETITVTADCYANDIYVDHDLTITSTNGSQITGTFYIGEDATVTFKDVALDINIINKM